MSESVCPRERIEVSAEIRGEPQGPLRRQSLSLCVFLVLMGESLLKLVKVAAKSDSVALELQRNSVKVGQHRGYFPFSFLFTSCLKLPAVILVKRKSICSYQMRDFPFQLFMFVI